MKQMGKFKYISIFLLGFLVALFVFGFTLPLLPYFRINYTVQGSRPDWLTAIFTLSATVSALIIAIWGKTLGQIFYKPDVRIVSHLENFQGTQAHTRLLFKNIGNTTAKDVEVYVEKIYDEIQVSRMNFLPVPLSWTHDGRSRRDFHPNQFGYLDLCRIDQIGNSQLKPKLVLSAGMGVSTYEDLRAQETFLVLTISQENGNIRRYQIDLLWHTNERPVFISKIQEVSLTEKFVPKIGIILKKAA